MLLSILNTVAFAQRENPPGAKKAPAPADAGPSGWTDYFTNERLVRKWC
jgi:hypothetical protein